MSEERQTPKSTAKVKKSKKAKDSNIKVRDVKSENQDTSKLVARSSPQKVSAQAAVNRTLSQGPETARKSGKSASFKIWSVVAGAAIILASIFWPRERAPNGTVIEEADVIDLNASRSAADQDLNAVQGTAASQDGVPTVEVASANPAAGSLGTSSDGQSGTPATSESSVFVPSAVAAVAAIPLPQGSWSVPAAMVLEITPKETVKLKAYIDGKATVTESLTPALHKFEFKEKADLYLYDASAVDIVFNGKNLGKVGNKGQFKRLSFVKTVK